MKRKRISSVFCICLMAMLIFLMSVNTQAAVTMNKKTAAIIKGSIISLKGTGTKPKPVWESSKPKVAKVTSKGVVKGINGGKAIIPATVVGTKCTCKVIVKEDIKNSKRQAAKR